MKRLEYSTKALEKRRKYHADHREEENAKARLNYLKNKEIRLKARREHYNMNKENELKKSKEYKEKNKELLKHQNRILYYNNHDYNLKMRREYHKRTYNVLRFEALTYYGNGKAICVCCGETNLRFLTLDHMNNDGHLQRRKTGTTIFRWLKTNGYPEGYQTLCFNCNCGRALNNEICPHKETNQTEKQNLPPIHLRWQGVA